MILFSSNYINSILKFKINEHEIVKKLKDYADYHEYDFDEVVYYFIFRVIKDGLYFGQNEENLKEILYLSIFWSSLNEYKNAKDESTKPTRKKTANLIKVNSKKKNLYTGLQSVLVKSIYRNFDGLERDEKLELYLLIFFECNCVKRKKKKG